MNFKDIEYFTAIWDYQNYSSAAEILHISQPALSQCIKKLEKEFTTALFKRNTKKLELTPAGEILYADGKSILTTKNKTIHKINALSRPEPISLKIGISPFYSKYYLPKLLPYFIALFPNLQYKIVEDISIRLEEKLQRGDLDICFVPLEPRNGVLDYQILCIEEILIALPQNRIPSVTPILGNGLPYLDIEQIKQMPFVSLKKIQKITSLTDRICRQIGFTPDVVYETLDWDTVDIMIASGIGVGFIPDILYSEHAKDTSRHYYRIANMPAFRHYAAAWRKGKTLSSTEQNIIDFFKKEIAAFHTTALHTINKAPLPQV